MAELRPTIIGGVATTAFAAIWLWPWLAPDHYHALTGAAQRAVFAAPMDGNPWWARVDHVLHAVIAFGAAIALASVLQGMRPGRARWFALALVALVAGLDEAVQWRTPSRDGDWFDLLSGALGLLAATPAITVLPAGAPRWRPVAAIVAPLLAVALGLVTAAITVDRTVLIDTAFGDASIPSRNERVTGPIPARWRENSHWADAWATSTPLSELEDRFLRVQVTRRDKGRVQWYHPLRTSEAAEAKLVLVARSPTLTRVELEWRILQKPYTRLWQRIVPLGDDWMTFEETFPMPRSEVPCGLFIGIPAVGTVDLRSMRVIEVPAEH